MNTETLKEAIRRELPGFIKADPEFRAYLLDLRPPPDLRTEIVHRQGRHVQLRA